MSPRRRRRLAIVVLALLTAATSPITSSAATSPPTARGSIVPYIAGAGGREVVVPNGLYTGGRLAAPHSDWLILRAESRGGVVVDLSKTGLRLDDGTSKIIFVGFKFVNGMIRLAGVQDVRFWYCDFSFPPEEWFRQYQAAGGYVPADHAARDEFMNKMANPLPTAVRTRAGMQDPSRQNRGLGFYGSDFHDLGDDGIFFYEASGVRMEGLRIWNVDEKSYDPGQAYANSGDWFHNDGIQTVGKVVDVQVTDSWFGQKVQWAASSGDIVDARFRRLWLAGSTTHGQMNGVSNGRKILRNNQDGIRAFANGQRVANHNKFRTDFVDGVQKAVWSKQYTKAGRFEIPSTAVTTSVPSGITITNGRLADINQVRNHSENPANRWRAAHPYNTWRKYLGVP